MAQKPSSRIKNFEAFVSDHFNIRYNTISNQVEYKYKNENNYNIVWSDGLTSHYTKSFMDKQMDHWNGLSLLAPGLSLCSGKGFLQRSTRVVGSSRFYWLTMQPVVVALKPVMMLRFGYQRPSRQSLIGLQILQPSQHQWAGFLQATLHA